MGSSPSKQQSKKDGGSLALLKSMSLPVTRSRLESPSDERKFTWKSGLSIMYKVAGNESFAGGLFGFSSLAGGLFGLSSTLQQVPEDDFDTSEPIDFKHVNRSPLCKNEKSFKCRTVSFQPTRDTVPQLTYLSSRKLLKEEMLGIDSTSKLSMKLDFACDPLPGRETENSAGLKSLHGTVFMPSCRSASPTSPVYNPNKAWVPSCSFSSRGENESSFVARSSRNRGAPLGNSVQTKLEQSPDKSNFSSCANDFQVLHDFQVKQDFVSRGNATQEGSPLFDPSILATFERALDCLSDDSDHSFDSNSDDDGSSVSESESISDSESLALPPDGVKNLQQCDYIRCHDDKSLDNSYTLRASPFLNGKASFSRVFSLRGDENWSGKDYLERFQMKCPPRGESKVVLYFTSLRAVRKTFENCCVLRLILKGLRIHVDERDVWMHVTFRKELTEIMGEAISVPRLYILGRYIGGAEEVEQLHEEGILGKMLEGLARDFRPECKVCRDVRFIPCITCYGSCKYISEEEAVEQCPDCNENGLIMCSYCDG